MGHPSALRIHAVSRGGVTYVRLNGTIDESFDPHALHTEAKGQKVILNLAGISRLTSFGVREWTNAMRELCSNIESVFFVEVSPAIVTQLNLVANFAGDAQVLSVQAPFYCDCGNETVVSMDLRGGTATLPEIQCSQCNQMMEFDEDPDSYFMFPLESARSRPVDPNIDVFLRHLSDSFDEGSGSRPRSIPSGPPSGVPSGIPSEPTRTSEFDIPVPSVASSVSSYPPMGGTVTGTGTSPGTSSVSMISQRPPARGGGRELWTNARSVLIGLAIPVIIAILLLALWPSEGNGSGLPEGVRGEYQAHMSEQRWGEAALMIRRLERQNEISSDAAAKLKEEIKEAALGPYAEHLEQQRFVEAARLVTQAARERVIPPRDSTRMHKEIMDRALARHRELLAEKQISAAEELSEGLLSRNVLPTTLRRSFQSDVALDRQHLAESLKRKAREAFEAERWEESLEASKIVARLGPLDPDMTYLLAETYRHLDNTKEAAVHYANFIGMVENDEPPHAALDGALFWRAKYLASAGRVKEANKLFQRVMEMNSKYRDSAARALNR